MHLSQRWFSLPGLMVTLVVCLLLCSCSTTDSASMSDDGVSSNSSLDGGALFAKDETAGMNGEQNRSWIVDSPPSAALEPSNWLEYSAYYLGEILLAPIRFIELIIDGA